MRGEKFVDLLLRCIEWRRGGAQTSEDDGLHKFSPDLNRIMAAIRNQQTGSTETVTLSSCRNKVLSSLILKPRRMESKASCRTPAGAPVPVSISLAARDASRERRRSLISTLLITKPRSFCSSVRICALLK